MTNIKNDFFAQEDITEALKKISSQQEEWKTMTGFKQNKFKARNMLVQLDKLTQSQFNALLHEWGA